MPKKVRILLVDDQQHVRHGLQMTLALEPDLEVVGEAANGAEALHLAVSLHPDVIVMDVEMPMLDGVAATTLLKGANSSCAVLILSLHDDPHTRDRALAAGAVAFVSKHESPTMLMTAIRQAAQRRLR